MTWEGLSPPYATIVADPPWPQSGGGPLTGPAGFGGAKGPSKPMPYSTMPVADIAALPVTDLVSDAAHLYLWTTNGFLRSAFEVMAAWGFRYSTTLVWAKNPMGGGLGGAHGITTEFVLFGRRGTLTAHGTTNTTWFNWKRPYRHNGKPEHSAKPEAFLDLVEQVSPGPYIELFCRRQRLGWDSWGHGYEQSA